MRIAPPNFTQTPNVFLDDIAKTLKEGELRVLLVIMRQTFGWQKEWDRISLSQLVRKTGMCRDAVNNSLKSLIDKNLISKRKEGTNGITKCWYSLVMEEGEKKDIEHPSDGIESEEDSNNFDQSSKTTPTSRLRRPTKETLTKEIKKKKAASPPKKEPLARPITLNSQTKKFEGISEDDLKQWQDTFPAVNVRKELQEALLWAFNTPRKNYRKSLNTWMSNVNKSHTTPFIPKTDISKKIVESSLEEDRKLAKEIERKHPTLFTTNVIQRFEERIEFVMGMQGVKLFFFGQPDFRKDCLAMLRRMTLSIEGL